MKHEFRISVSLAVAPEKLFAAWMSSKDHSAFTGGAAKIVNRVGGRFTTWDGYISGKTLRLEPPNRIIQSWRTTDFPAEAPDSILEITIERAKIGSKLTLFHKDIPAGQVAQYKQGWKDYYFSPMRDYFSKKGK